MRTDQIWNEFSENILRYITKVVKDEDTAKDIRQEVFIKIHLNVDKLSEVKNLNSWIFTVTKNSINDYYRSNKNYQFTNEIPDIADNEKHYGDQHEFCCLRPFINRLPDLYKNTFVLSELRGKTHKEISNILNITVTASKSRVQRAREILKKEFVSCCNYEIGKDGKLYGEQDCPTCGH